MKWILVALAAMAACCVVEAKACDRYGNDFAFQRAAPVYLYDAPLWQEVRRVEVYAPRQRVEVREVRIEKQRRGGGLAAIAAALAQRRQVSRSVEVRREVRSY